MNILSQNIISLMKQKGLTQKELADRAGISQVTVHKLVSGKINKTAQILGIASALECDPNWLATGVHPQKREPSNVEKGPDIQGYYPLLDWIQAGDWTCINAIQPNEAEYFPCLVPCSPKTFALKVRGESMSPKFEENELIFVDPNVEPINGKYVVAMLDDENEATFKQLIIDGNQKYLKATNPDWPKKYLEIDGNCTIVGVVISATRFL